MGAPHRDELIRQHRALPDDLPDGDPEATRLLTEVGIYSSVATSLELQANSDPQNHGVLSNLAESRPGNLTN